MENNGWINEKLGSVLEIKYGKDHKKLNEGTYPCLGSGGIMRYVDSYLYDDESILIPRKGSLNNIIFQNNPFWTVDTMFWSKIDRSRVFPKYLFYQLTLIDYEILNVGSAVPSLTVPVIKEIEIQLPPLCEQKAIANVLSSLDDKIDLLHQQNQTLESLAETLFRQWFIEEAKDDWKEKKLGEITEIKAGGDKPKKYSNIKSEEFSIPIYSNGIDKKGLYGFTDIPKILDECITISARGTIGFVCLRKEPFVPIVRLITIKSKHNHITNNYLYLWAKSQNISGTGSTQEQLTVPDISNTDIIIPPKFKMEKFSECVDKYFDKIESNEIQIQTLTKLRDTLLPKLMSGEVRVQV